MENTAASVFMLITKINELLPAAWEWFKGLSFVGMYGVLCIFCLPFSLWFTIRLYTNTNFLAKVDSLLDKKKRKEKAASSPLPEPAGSSPKEETMDDPNVAVFRLYVGNGYKCRMTDDDATATGGREWFSENPFVGNCDKSNLFRAKKVGETCVLCGNRTYYKIIVVPNNFNWIGEDACRLVFEHRPIDVFKANLIAEKRKLVSADFDKGCEKYSGIGNEISVAFMYDPRTFKTDRILYEVKLDSAEVDSLIEDLEERMEPLLKYNALGERIEEQDIRLWYHTSSLLRGDKVYQYVDAVAFLKEIGRDRYAFGIGKSWRTGAEVVEVQDNRNMIMKSFYDILPDELKKEVVINDRKFVTDFENETDATEMNDSDDIMTGEPEISSEPQSPAEPEMNRDVESPVESESDEVAEPEPESNDSEESSELLMEDMEIDYDEELAVTEGDEEEPEPEEVEYEDDDPMDL